MRHEVLIRGESVLRDLWNRKRPYALGISSLYFLALPSVHIVTSGVQSTYTDSAIEHLVNVQSSW